MISYREIKCPWFLDLHFWLDLEISANNILWNLKFLKANGALDDLYIREKPPKLGKSCEYSFRRKQQFYSIWSRAWRFTQQLLPLSRPSYFDVNFFVHEISFRSRGPWGFRPETLAGWSNVKLFLCKNECQHFSIDFGCANLLKYANDGNWRNFLFRIAIWIILFSLFPNLNSLFQVKHFVNGWGLFRLTSLESKWIVRSDQLEIFED